MPDPTATFFDDLRRRRHVPAIGRFTGTLRIDLTDNGQLRHWLLEMADGEVTVSEEDRPADCVITAERQDFDQIAIGGMPPLAAWLRNQVTVEGAFRPLLLLERLLPEPPGVHDPRDLVRRDGPPS